MKHRTGLRTAVRIAASLVLAAPAWFLAAEIGWACTCSAPGTTDEALKRSAMVFSGRVIGINRPFLDRIGLTRSGSYHVEFEVLKSWKGVSSRTVTIVTRLSGEACGFPFEKDKEYLVYAVAEPSDIQSGICTGTKGLAAGAAELKELDRLTAVSRD